MNTEHLLRAVRPVYALVRRPGEAPSVEPKFWSMRLDGLHQNAIKASADALRSYRKSRGRNLLNDETLKLSGLHHGLAKALGAKTFDAWRQGEEALAAFLVANDMTEPANLISWSVTVNPPAFFPTLGGYAKASGGDWRRRGVSKDAASVRAHGWPDAD